MKTLKCGLLGRKLAHSYSPMIHGCLGDYSYALFQKEEGELAAFFADANAFDAINVTIPYKETVMAYCHHISPEALAIGAVNTIVRRDGELWGYNTDYSGFRALLEKVCDVRGKKVLVLGSGGASKTACAVIRDQGGSPVVISRSGENNYENLSRHYEDTHVVVNTTPVGMYPHCPAAPLSLKPFQNLSAVVDIIYNPARTGLLLEAEELGIPCVNGLYMLVEQARAASELFTGSTLPVARNEEITQRIARDMENLVFVGMPGCGKSTIGRMLAEKTGLEFFDSDEQVQRITGEHPGDIIIKQGEAAFRAVETRALAELCGGSGRIISCGGGVVTRRENWDILRQNSRVIWLRRDLDKLATQGRPLSASPEAVAALYESRRAAYEAVADVVLENNHSPETTLSALLAALGR